MTIGEAHADGLVAGRPRLHLSVDDCLTAFVEVSDRGQRPQEHPTFAFLAALHRDFGVDIDLYLFAAAELAGRRRNLAEVSARNRADYAAMSWLRLGPHGRDPDLPPHAQPPAAARQTLLTIDREIRRVAGASARPRWLRLHEFSECYECADLLRALGVEALLATDRPAVAYRLPPSARRDLATRGSTVHAGMRFVRSHLRLEQAVTQGLSGNALAVALDRLQQCYGHAVVFTHEAELADPRVRDAARTCAAWAARAAQQTCDAQDHLSSVPIE